MRGRAFSSAGGWLGQPRHVRRHSSLFLRRLRRGCECLIPGDSIGGRFIIIAAEIRILVGWPFPRHQAQFINERAVILPPLVTGRTALVFKILFIVGWLASAALFQFQHSAEDRNGFRRDPRFGGRLIGRLVVGIGYPS